MGNHSEIPLCSAQQSRKALKISQPRCVISFCHITGTSRYVHLSLMLLRYQHGKKRTCLCVVWESSHAASSWKCPRFLNHLQLFVWWTDRQLCVNESSDRHNYRWQVTITIWLSPSLFLLRHFDRKKGELKKSHLHNAITGFGGFKSVVPNPLTVEQLVPGPRKWIDNSKILFLFWFWRIVLLENYQIRDKAPQHRCS